MGLDQVAMMLGRNRVEPREPWPDDAPDISTVRRVFAMERGLVPPKRDDPIGDDEYRMLLKQVIGGKRKS